jgi:hypothetical protein
MGQGGRDALLIGAQHTVNAEGWRVTVVPCNFASAAAVATITGIVKIRNIVGRCTTAIATTTSIQLSMAGTAMTASTDVVGHGTTMILLRESGTATVLTEVTTPVGSLWAAPTEYIAGQAGSASGILSVLKDASGTGVINWAIEWTPLSSNAGIVADQA